MAIILEGKEGRRVIFDTIYKYNTIGVVNLMLENPSEEAFCSHPKLFALHIKSADSDFGVARDFTVDIGNAKAALKILFNFTFVFCNFGINKNGKCLIILVVKIITNDDNSQELINLYGR